MYTTDEHSSASSGKVHPAIDDVPRPATQGMDEQVGFQPLPSAPSHFDGVAPIEVQSKERQPKGNEPCRDSDSGMTEAEFPRGLQNIRIQVDTVGG